MDVRDSEAGDRRPVYCEVPFRLQTFDRAGSSPSSPRFPSCAATPKSCLFPRATPSSIASHNDGSPLQLRNAIRMRYSCPCLLESKQCAGVSVPTDSSLELEGIGDFVRNGFSVGNLKRPQFRIDLILLRNPVSNDLQVQLSHACRYHTSLLVLKPSRTTRRRKKL